MCDKLEEFNAPPQLLKTGEGVGPRLDRSQQVESGGSAGVEIGQRSGKQL